MTEAEVGQVSRELLIGIHVHACVCTQVLNSNSCSLFAPVNFFRGKKRF